MIHWKLQVEEGVARAILDKSSTEVNVLTTEVMNELKTLLGEVSQRKDIRALLFVSAKSRIFIAGADINEIAGIKTIEDGIEKAEMGKAVFKLIEDLTIPTVSVINGACLGGGYELSLACDYRVASTSDQVKIGLPEVNLGILPGFGGSIRLPRLLGLAGSLPLILSGMIVDAKKAKKLGMVDKLFGPDELQAKSLQFIKELLSKGGELKRKIRVPFWEKNIAGPLWIFPFAKNNVMKKTKGFYLTVEQVRQAACTWVEAQPL